MQLNDDQKRIIIETAQELYRKMYDARCQEDPVALEVDINTFKEACYDMAMLVHYLAKEMYNIPDEENIIYNCEFRYKGTIRSHYYNKICERIVDSTIAQFGLSSYDNHDSCYTNEEEVDYCNASIRNEIELYEVHNYVKEFFRVKSSTKEMETKKSNWYDNLIKLFKK